MQKHLNKGRFSKNTTADNPLDNSAVHPESYNVVEKMAKDLNSSKELIGNKELIENIDIKRYKSDRLDRNAYRYFARIGKTR